MALLKVYDSCHQRRMIHALIRTFDVVNMRVMRCRRSDSADGGMVKAGTSSRNEGYVCVWTTRNPRLRSKGGCSAKARKSPVGIETFLPKPSVFLDLPSHRDSQHATTDAVHQPPQVGLDLDIHGFLLLSRAFSLGGE